MDTQRRTDGTRRRRHQVQGGGMVINQKHTMQNRNMWCKRVSGGWGQAGMCLPASAYYAPSSCNRRPPPGWHAQRLLLMLHATKQRYPSRDLREYSKNSRRRVLLGGGGGGGHTAAVSPSTKHRLSYQESNASQKRRHKNNSECELRLNRGANSPNDSHG